MGLEGNDKEYAFLIDHLERLKCRIVLFPYHYWWLDGEERERLSREISAFLDELRERKDNA